MTLEQRLADALHEVDGFDPSPDLFARVNRSLGEDRAHRRRLIAVWFGASASAAVVVLYLGLLVSRDRSGALAIPVWAMEVLETVLLIAIVLLLAPVIRRFGGFYVADVFRLAPETGPRFLRLLDTAYYLLFTGAILSGMSLTSLQRTERLGEGLDAAAGRIAVLLGLMGVLHAGNLLVMPLVGLVFSSTVRRVARASAGPSAPPLSRSAARVDRIASGIVWALAAAVAIGALLSVGIVIGAGVG